MVAVVFTMAERRLYLCTPIRSDLTAFVGAVIDGGVDVIQLREKHADARTVLAAARELRALCRDRGVPFILNDRADLAYDVGADGVHVGQDDAPVALCRSLLGPDAIIGLSTHGDADLAGALGQDVNYLSAGPIEPTPTKPGRAGTGLAYASEATEKSPWPVFVTGGVTAERVSDLVNAGVRHFVVVRYLTESTNPRRDAQQLSEAIDASLS